MLALGILANNIATSIQPAFEKYKPLFYSLFGVVFFIALIFTILSSPAVSINQLAPVSTPSGIVVTANPMIPTVAAIATPIPHPTYFPNWPGIHSEVLTLDTGELVVGAAEKFGND